MLRISRHVSIPAKEIEISAVRSQGAGGQNVNKLATAVHLRFDIRHSTLPDAYKQRLLALRDQRISKDGVIVIKSQQYRSQDKNRAAALGRLQALVKGVAAVRKKRLPTRPSRRSQEKRLEQKRRHGKDKALRRRLTDEA